MKSFSPVPPRGGLGGRGGETERISDQLGARRDDECRSNGVATTSAGNQSLNQITSRLLIFNPSKSGNSASAKFYRSKSGIKSGVMRLKSGKFPQVVGVQGVAGIIPCQLVRLGWWWGGWEGLLPLRSKSKIKSQKAKVVSHF